MQRILFYMLFFIVIQNVDGAVVGSYSAVSRQGQAAFPSSDLNNEMLGFTRFEEGFYLENNLTTCTFNALLPMSCCANLNGGTLFLQNDLTMDSQASIFSPGCISGNFHAMDFVTTCSGTILPSSNQNFLFEEISHVSLGFRPIAADWALDSSYIAVGNYLTTGEELRLYYFDGTTLSATPTVSLEIGNRVLSLRWHPTDRFFAVGFSSGSGDEVQVYKHNISNGTIELLDGISFSGHVYAVEWHPSGNFLAVGGTNNSKKVIIFAFDQNVGTLTEVDNLLLSSNRYPFYSALSFSPDGKYLAVGTLRSGQTSLDVLKFDGTSLVSDATVDTGGHCYTVDWHPTDSLIAAGSSTNVQAHRIYEHNRNTSSIVEKTSAQTNESTTVFTTHWHDNGEYFVYGNFNGSNSQSKIFFYNKNDCISTKVTDKFIGNTVTDNRWSPDGNYLSSVAYSTQSIRVFGIADDTMTFKNVALYFHSPVKLGADWKFSGQSTLNMGGATLDLSSYSMQISPNSCLEICFAKILGIKEYNMRCMHDNSSIVFKNCILKLESDYTFSCGSFVIQDEVVWSGPTHFNYTTEQTSSILSGSVLMVENGLTFYYQPSVANKNLIYFEDSTAELYFDNSSLVSSSTGLYLDNGTLIFDNFVTVSNSARFYAEGLEISESVNIILNSDATIDAHGFVRFIN